MDGAKLQEFRRESREQLMNLKPEMIELYDTKSELPPLYSLVFQPTQKDLIEKIHKLQDHLRSIEPNNYYYSDTEFHSTIIGNFPVSLGYEKLLTVIQKYLQVTNFKFQVTGLGSNRFCSSVSCYPVDFSIHEFREKIRKDVGDHGDDLKVHLETYEYMGWINYMRYMKTPSEKLLEALRSYIDTDFGIWSEGKLRLYETTSKTLNPLKRTLIWEY
ncbi:MAG: hypothetical protein U0525_03670 [Patescibacteria group bacterium]